MLYHLQRKIRVLVAKRVDRRMKNFSLQSSVKRTRWMTKSGNRVDAVLTRLRLEHGGLASYLKVIANIQTVFVSVEVWKQSNMLCSHVTNT